MRNFFESMLISLRTFFSRLTKRERIRLGIIAGSILLMCILLAVFLNRVEYDVLFRGLPESKAGQAIDVLEEMQVPYRTSGSGTILVPADQVTTLTMKLANVDALKDDSFDYMMYAGFTNNMTTTEKDRRIYLEYAIGDHLRTALVQNPAIEDAWVIVRLAESSSFILSNKTPASASLELKISGGRRLTNEEVKGITEYVKGAVPDISEDNIKIIDTNCNFYSVMDDPLSADITNQLAFKYEAQTLFESQISKVLMPLLGLNGFRVAVDATLDFSKEVVDSTVWAPPVAGSEQGLVISTSKLFESVRPGFNEGDIPGTDTNGLGTAEYPYGEITNDEEYRKAVEETNYELNEVHTLIEKAEGQITDLTVAVTVDSNIISEDLVSEIQKLVAGAINTDTKKVVVVRAPFLENNEVTEALALQAEFNAKKQQQEMIKLIIVVACILASVILLVVMLISIAKIYNRRMEEEARALSAQIAAEAAAARAAASEYGYMPGGGYNYLISDETETAAGMTPDAAAVVAAGYAAIAELDENGEPVKPIETNAPKSELVIELEDFIERDPVSAVAMLRNWLTDE